MCDIRASNSMGLTLFLISKKIFEHVIINLPECYVVKRNFRVLQHSSICTKTCLQTPIHIKSTWITTAIKCPIFFYHPRRLIKLFLNLKIQQLYESKDIDEQFMSFSQFKFHLERNSMVILAYITHHLQRDDL